MVNTTAAHLNLANGAVSTSILKIAGPQIQAAVYQQLPRNSDCIAFGSVVETLGYNLPCSRVYHGACQNWDNGTGRCEKVCGQIFVYITCIYISDAHFSAEVPFLSALALWLAQGDG